MPKWYMDEQLQMETDGPGPHVCQHTTPEHFELYRGLQHEWWCHETYVRIAALYFISHWLTATCLWMQCHCFSELRALWPAWAITFLYCVAHYVLLKIDILPVHRFFFEFYRLEDIYPWMPILACWAMSWEYSSVPSGDGWRVLIYVFAWFCYAIQLIWAIKLYFLAQPMQQDEHEDIAGQAWWPADWSVPPSFNGAVYLLAPPMMLDSTVPNCLQLEMKAAKGVRGCVAPLKKQRRVRPQTFPWKLFRAALICSIAIWVFIIAGRIWENCRGERRLLKGEGRQIRWPARVQPGLSPWTRSGVRGEMAHAGGSDRRVSHLESAPSDDVAVVAKDLVQVVGSLFDTMHWWLQSQKPHLPTPTRTSLAAFHADAVWPLDMEPSLLVSTSDRLVAAITKNRKGAVIHLPAHGMGITKVPTVHEWAGWIPFSLANIDHLGDIHGASWSHSGLLVSTSSGAVAECKQVGSLPFESSWPCRQVGPLLPSGGSSLAAAVVVRIPNGNRLRAAVTFADEQFVALLEASEDSLEWLPAGEVQLQHSHRHSALHLSFSTTGDELIISSPDGNTVTWRPEQQEPVPTGPLRQSGTRYHAACSLSDGRLAYLATQGFGTAGLELLLSDKL